jgi:Kae1-associated kinase Bud32
MKQIAQGAEAKLFKKNKTLVKDRVRKTYRIEEIDKRLRKRRTKKEAKILEKIQDLNFTPKLIGTDNQSKIEMEFIDGITLRDHLNKDNYKKPIQELGKKIAILHNQGIIHGDLTTSNFIVKDNKIFFIDFGLSFEEDQVEHKAVDLHLLKQALDSKHYEIAEKAFKEVLKSYKSESKEGKEVLERLKQVETRGRYKHK